MDRREFGFGAIASAILGAGKWNPLNWFGPKCDAALVEWHARTGTPLEAGRIYNLRRTVNIGRVGHLRGGHIRGAFDRGPLLNVQGSHVTFDTLWLDCQGKNDGIYFGAPCPREALRAPQTHSRREWFQPRTWQ